MCGDTSVSMRIYATTVNIHFNKSAAMGEWKNIVQKQL